VLALLEAGERDAFNAAMSAGPADPERERTFAFRAKPYGGEKQIVRFTREQGADFHCQPMARALTGMVMTDFLTDHLE
jgi:hypothetical protein